MDESWIIDLNLLQLAHDSWLNCSDSRWHAQTNCDVRPVLCCVLTSSSSASYWAYCCSIISLWCLSCSRVWLMSWATSLCCPGRSRPITNLQRHTNCQWEGGLCEQMQLAEAIQDYGYWFSTIGYWFLHTQGGYKNVEGEIACHSVK